MDSRFIGDAKLHVLLVNRRRLFGVVVLMLHISTKLSYVERG